MMKKPVKTVQILSRAGVVLFCMTAAVMGVHFAVMFLESWVIKAPLLLNFEKDFVGTAFSAAMIPVLCAYALFAIVAYYLWIRMKRVLLEAQALELRAEKEKVVMESTQRLVGVLASHITLHNAEIIKWVEHRKSLNKQIPEIVEQSSRNIAAVLETLTEAAFIAPYSKDSGSVAKAIDEIDTILSRKLPQPHHDVPDYV